MRLHEIMQAVWDDVPDADLRGFVREVNRAVDDIALQWWWPFRQTSHDFSLAATYTDGSVAVAEGSDSVTGAGVTWTSTMEGRRFRVDGDARSYEVKGVSGDTITLDRPYEGDTDADAGYRIYQDTYPLPSDFVRMGRNGLWRLQYNMPVEPVPRGMFEAALGYHPGLETIGTTLYYTLLNTDASGNRLLQLSHVPSAQEVLRVWYQRSSVVVEDPEDEPDLPDELQWALVDKLKVTYLGRVPKEERDPVLMAQFLSGYQQRLRDARVKWGQQAAIPMRGGPGIFA